jgi:TPR repeat protein
MHLNKDFKKRFINHISFTSIIVIILLAFSLESCLENASLPFSKASTAKDSYKTDSTLFTKGKKRKRKEKKERKYSTDSDKKEKKKHKEAKSDKETRPATTTSPSTVTTTSAKDSYKTDSTLFTKGTKRKRKEKKERKYSTDSDKKEKKKHKEAKSDKETRPATTISPSTATTTSKEKKERKYSTDPDKKEKKKHKKFKSNKETRPATTISPSTATTTSKERKEKKDSTDSDKKEKKKHKEAKSNKETRPATTISPSTATTTSKERKEKKDSTDSGKKENKKEKKKHKEAKSDKETRPATTISPSTATTISKEGKEKKGSTDSGKKEKKKHKEAKSDKETRPATTTSLSPATSAKDSYKTDSTLLEKRGEKKKKKKDRKAKPSKETSVATINNSTATTDYSKSSSTVLKNKIEGERKKEIHDKPSHKRARDIVKEKGKEKDTGGRDILEEKEDKERERGLKLLKAEEVYQEAEALMAQYEKAGMKGKRAKGNLTEIVTKYQYCASVGYELAQDRLRNLRDNQKYISRNLEVEDKLRHIARRYADSRRQPFPISDSDNLLRLSDLIVMKLKLERAPTYVEWGGATEDILVTGPLFISDEEEEYEDAIMIIDTAGTGSDETAYCIAKRYKDYYFIIEVGGLGGEYIEDPKKRTPSSSKLLNDIEEIVKRHKIQYIKVERNVDNSYIKVLKDHLINASIITKVEGYQQTKSLTATTESAGQGKEKRIIGCLQPLLQNHKIIISQEALIKDIFSAPEKDFHYKFFYQLARIKVPQKKEKKASVSIEKEEKKTRITNLQHDDRIDAVSSAIIHLQKRRQRTQEETTNSAIDTANMYRYGQGIKKDFEKAYGFYLQALKKDPKDSEALGEKGWYQYKYLDEEEGLNDLKASARGYYSAAKYKLAKLCLEQTKTKAEGKEILESVVKFKDLYLEDAGYFKSHFALAEIYYEEGNFQKAFEHYKKVAKSDLELQKKYKSKIYSRAQYKLGCMYYKGRFIRQNFKRSLKYFLTYLNSIDNGGYHNSKSQEYMHASYQLAKIYHFGKGILRKNLDLALLHYIKAINLERKGEKVQTYIKNVQASKIKLLEAS